MDDLGSCLPLWSGKVIKMCKEEKEILRLLYEVCEFNECKGGSVHSRSLVPYTLIQDTE